MTRITICRSEKMSELMSQANEDIARLEKEGLGVKEMFPLPRVTGADPYALVIVYGNGPITTHRWSGGTVA